MIDLTKQNSTTQPLMTTAAQTVAASPSTGYDPKKYEDLAKDSQIEATTNDFDESKGVAGRVNDLVSKNNPLMQTAITRANQAANAKGLRNSSMAVQAGQQAVIETATPIASADAGLFQQQRLANQDALNNASQFNSNARTTVGLEGAKAGETARQFDASAKIDYARLASNEKIAALDAATRKTLATMDADNRIKLAEIEAGFKNEIAGNENIANAWGTLMQNINQIQNNPDMAADAKRINIENQIASFQAFTSFWKKSTGGSIDVGDLLNFGVDSGPNGTTLPPAEDKPAEQEAWQKLTQPQSPYAPIPQPDWTGG